ncbi:helix-turn-helix domain-containing protein [Enterococcus sp. BWR-S5]|uniref:helix-turn-helix domain-containing protein n=1 Tax=Enterococcus sp. BWR-S5 TaxID=2787714 RepID=UPI0019240F3B|nr:helix-turn-helix transcriptional regulator [Enterococcus sp. BWR-S5]MBL1227047.1 helix-turn-helix transcriptional regulator [Enterococcus sp. BWR-S5]
MEIGKKIKRLRIERGFTQVQIKPQHITQSRYSKFEKGETSLSFEDIYEVLTNLQVTMQEFEFFLEPEEFGPIKYRKKLFAYFADPENPENIAVVTQMYQELQEKRSKGDIHPTELMVLFDLKLVCHKIVDQIEEMQEDDLYLIKEMILSRQYHSYYDLKLLSNHIAHFDKKDIETFVKCIFPIPDVATREADTKTIISYFFINIVTKFCYLQEWEDVKYYIKQGHEYCTFGPNYYLKTTLKYYEYLSDYFLTKDFNYLHKATNILSCMLEIGDDKAYKALSDEFNFLMKQEGIDLPTPNHYGGIVLATTSS